MALHRVTVFGQNNMLASCFADQSSDQNSLFFRNYFDDKNPLLMSVDDHGNLQKYHWN